MRPTRWRVAAAVGVAALTLLGCTPEETPEPSAPTPSAPPSYSDEELLEQARETYEGYLAAYEEMVAADDVDYTVLLPYATEELATAEAAGEQDLRGEGIQSSGAMTLISMQLEEDSSPSSPTALACHDATTYVFLDSEGNDVTPTDAPTEVSLVVQFERDEASDQLMVSALAPSTPDAEASCSTS